jgi:hypothetical protein
MLIFVRFFPFFLTSGRKYRILVMHKKQSVKTKVMPAFTGLGRIKQISYIRKLNTLEYAT